MTVPIVAKKLTNCKSVLLLCFYIILIPIHSSSEIRVIDADTIVLNGEKVRLSGIDAPETSQTCLNANNKQYPCGKLASEELMKLIARNHSKTVICKYSDLDQYGRLIGNCWINGIFINSWLVSNGWAMAYRHYSLDFVKEEMIARRKKVGIWDGTFVEPWKWRSAARFSLKEIPIPENCSIKGNISSSGKKIYHIPGGEYYRLTKISEAKGEVWFCSEQEAENSGWRKSKR